MANGQGIWNSTCGLWTLPFRNPILVLRARASTEGFFRSRPEPEAKRESAVNELEQRIFSEKQRAEEPAEGEDRRREPRIQVDRLVYVELAETGAGHFEEVRCMRDLSRSGFYFITDRNSYQPGMKLHVVPAFGCLNLEYTGEVVRIETLPFDEFGIAVRLLRVENMVSGNRTSTMRTFEALARGDSSPVALPEPEPELINS